MQRRRAVRAVGLGVAGVLALAGCAAEPQSAGEAWQQARTQLDEAQTVRLETAHRYAVPQEVADAAMGEGDLTRLHSFTVDEDGGLLALTVDDGRALRQYALSDWNEIDPAEAPEEVAE